jgi:hypothetical protein
VGGFPARCRKCRAVAESDRFKEEIMAGRGPQSFKKRQKEQQRREKHQEKLAKRLERKQQPRTEDEEPVMSVAELIRAEDAATRRQSS